MNSLCIPVEFVSIVTLLKVYNSYHIHDLDIIHISFMNIY